MAYTYIIHEPERVTACIAYYCVANPRYGPFALYLLDGFVAGVFLRGSIASNNMGIYLEQI